MDALGILPPQILALAASDPSSGEFGILYTRQTSTMEAKQQRADSSERTMLPINGSLAVQIIRIATISSVQILLLVIAGTSGFIVSLLGLMVPDSLKASPVLSSNKSTSSSPRHPGTHRRSQARGNVDCPSPIITRTCSSSSPAPSLSTSGLGITNDQSSYRLAIGRTDAPLDGFKSLQTAHPMKRGSSGSSRTSSLPELGVSSGTVTSCSSSISDHHHGSHDNKLHYGLIPNALFEGIACKSKAKRAAHHSKKNEQHAGIAAEENDPSPSRSGGDPTSPQKSPESLKARLSTLMLPHSQTRQGTCRTFSNRRCTSSGNSSPVTPEDGPSGSPTWVDASLGCETGYSSTLSKLDNPDRHMGGSASRASIHAARPPFLTRVFNFSSSSSISKTSLSSFVSISESVSTSSTQQASPFASPLSATPVSSSASIASLHQAGEGTRTETGPRTRRLSTRLVSFGRIMSSTRYGGIHRHDSRRVISETGTLASYVDAECFVRGESRGSVATQQGPELQGPEREMPSPPQTPGLMSPTSSSSVATPSSIGPDTPHQSPLLRRSFLNTSASPSKQKYFSSLRTSPTKA